MFFLNARQVYIVNIVMNRDSQKNQLGSELISVIIPTYNEKGTLENTLKSVLNQTYTNFEVIIVDDGSDISPEPIVQRVADRRIALYRTDRGNANIARNYGILKSTGKYIAMLDADDQWLENHLESCLALLKQSEADGLYGSLFLSKECANIVDVVNSGQVGRYIARELNDGESMIDYLLKTTYGAQTSTLFTTADSAKDILWNAELIDHQDYDFVVRFCKKFKMVPKKAPTVLYYLSSGRSFHFETCIKFVEMNLKDIDPVIYNNYNLKMFFIASERNAPANIIKYFKKEAIRYKECISYHAYISIKDPKNRFQELIDKIVYIFHIFKVKVCLNTETK